MINTHEIKNTTPISIYDDGKIFTCLFRIMFMENEITANEKITMTPAGGKPIFDIALPIIGVENN